MIKVKNLTKKYQNSKALQDVSFEVAKGEVVGFLGPNGAGKTTTMRILTGFLPMTSGQATIDGLDVFKDSLKIREKIGYLPETTPLYPEMSILEFLNFIAELKKVPREKRQEDVSRSLDKCDLEDVKNKIIKTLSKGYRQRVGIAQALLGNPDVLILDEPTIGLDPKQIIQIRKLIKNLGREKTIILSTHILQEVSAVCDKVIIINEGKTVAIDTPENLTSKFSGGMIVNITVKGNAEQVKNCLSGLENIKEVNIKNQTEGKVQLEVKSKGKSDSREIIASAIVRNGWGLLEISQEKMGLEEIFVKLTGKNNE
ncbi:ABC transporter ATP-binding protein [Patescibacteria group bacterium]|nr:ABC transporter ATP-binding protein [Patescibacteria group bacterium]